MKLKEVMTSMDYEKLYKAYYLQVYSYTISLAKNREIAEEITQNTFYKAVSTTSQFKGKSDELTWLCSIAKNLYHDEMRSRQRVADVSEINDLPSNENVENSVADSDMAFRIHLFFTVWKNHTKKSFSFAYSGNYLFHKSLQFLENRIMGESYLSSCKAKNSRKDG